MQKLLGIVIGMRRKREQRREIRELRSEVEKLRRENLQMREAMRRCLACDYRIQVIGRHGRSTLLDATPFSTKGEKGGAHERAGDGNGPGDRDGGK